MAALKPLYRNTVIGTVAVDGWAVTFGTARTGLGGAAASPGTFIFSSSSSSSSSFIIRPFTIYGRLPLYSAWRSVDTWVCLLVPPKWPDLLPQRLLYCSLYFWPWKVKGQGQVRENRENSETFLAVTPLHCRFFCFIWLFLHKAMITVWTGSVDDILIMSIFFSVFSWPAATDTLLYVF